MAIIEVITQTENQNNNRRIYIYYLEEMNKKAFLAAAMALMSVAATAHVIARWDPFNAVIVSQYAGTLKFNDVQKDQTYRAETTSSPCWWQAYGMALPGCSSSGCIIS